MDKSEFERRLDIFAKKHELIKEHNKLFEQGKA